MNKRFLFAIIVVITFALDRITKVMAESRIPSGSYKQVLGSFLEFRHVRNEGIAFGMFSGAGSLLIISTVVVGTLLVFFLLKFQPDDLSSRIGSAFIAGGALGNLYDRIAYRYVIDFIHVPHFPTFNVADIWITLGVVLVLIGQLIYSKQEGESQEKGG